MCVSQIHKKKIAHTKAVGRVQTYKRWWRDECEIGASVAKCVLIFFYIHIYIFGREWHIHIWWDDDIMCSAHQWNGKWSGNERNGSHSKNAISFENKRPNNDVRHVNTEQPKKNARHINRSKWIFGSLRNWNGRFFFPSAIPNHTHSYKE